MERAAGGAEPATLAAGDGAREPLTLGGRGDLETDGVGVPVTEEVGVMVGSAVASAGSKDGVGVTLTVGVVDGDGATVHSGSLTAFH